MADTSRVTQVYVKALVLGEDSSINVTQVVAQVLRDAESSLRMTQQVLQVLRDAEASLRMSQIVVQALVNPTPVPQEPQFVMRIPPSA